MTPPPPPSVFLPVSSCGFVLEFPCYPDVASFDAAAGISGKCLELAHRYLVYRDCVDSSFPDTFTPIVESTFGIERIEDPAKTAIARKLAKDPTRVTPVRESFKTYINRVRALIDEPARHRLHDLALECSRTIAIDASPGEARIITPVHCFKKADSILSDDLATINSKVSRFLALVPDYKLARDESDRPTRAGLARLIFNYETQREAMED